MSDAILESLLDFVSHFLELLVFLKSLILYELNLLLDEFKLLELEVQLNVLHSETLHDSQLILCDPVGVKLLSNATRLAHKLLESANLATEVGIQLHGDSCLFLQVVIDVSLSLVVDLGLESLFLVV